ncbi:MAG TPA: hypothetical protein VIT68_00590, partial [Candidatus Gracilibacteria bacterium]
DATGKAILSNYHEDATFPVYEKNYWWGDAWNALDHGRDFDFSRAFFEQFHELNQVVPRMNLIIVANEGCDYVSMTGWCKNCYLIYEAERNHDCMFSEYIYDCKNVLDSSFCRFCELCYECINCERCYNGLFLQDCENCSDSAFLKDCIGCKNCFGSINLRNKEYYFMNEKCEKSVYEEKIAALKLGQYESISGLRDHFKTFCQKYPHKYYTGKNNEDVSGNYLKNNKACFECYDTEDCRDGRFLYNSVKGKDCFDVNLVLQNAERIYDSNCIGHGAQNVYFTFLAWENVSDVYYSEMCTRSQNVFGCSGVRNVKHCILNKAYTQHEYEKLSTKIIQHMKETGEWGEFFPISMSPFAYNETVAQEYFPLTKEEALERGYGWRGEEESSPLKRGIQGVSGTPQAPLDKGGQISDNIKDIPDSIINETLYCEISGKPYRIQKAELKFYRKMKLPIPRLHPDVRHLKRMKLRNPRELWNRKCAHTGKELLSTYSPDRPETILSEEAYAEVII